LGTLLLGFYLLPLFGTYTILLVLAFILLCLSLALAGYETVRKRRKHTLLHWFGLSAPLFVFLIWQLFALGGKHINENYEVLFEEETHYGWVRVVDQKDGDIRWLMSDASTI